MRKFAMLIGAFAGSAALYAAPVGNTSAPQMIERGLFVSCDSWIDFRVGYEGDFVSDGRLKQFNQGSGRVDTYEQWTHSGTFMLNILDRLDVYGVFGSSRTEADWRFETPSAGTVTRIELKTESSFLWGIGARTIVYEWCNVSFGLGGRYSSSNYEPAWLTSDGLAQSVSGSHFNWREWQINMDASYRISLFTPYIGVKYSNARTHLKDFIVPISADLSGNNSFKNRIPVGLYVGCALSTRRYFMLNIEGRVIDEEAVTISAEFRF